MEWSGRRGRFEMLGEGEGEGDVEEVGGGCGVGGGVQEGGGGVGWGVRLVLSHVACTKGKWRYHVRERILGNKVNARLSHFSKHEGGAERAKQLPK